MGHGIVLVRVLETKRLFKRWLLDVNWTYPRFQELRAGWTVVTHARFSQRLRQMLLAWIPLRRPSKQAIYRCENATPYFGTQVVLRHGFEIGIHRKSCR